MTRDEAVEIIHGVTYPQTSCGDVGDYSFDRDRKWSERIVDGLVALGILKLDEPSHTGVKSKIRKMAINYASQGSIFDWIDRLDIAGLKIVEK